MRKFIIILLVFTLLTGTACAGKKQNNTTEPPKPKTTEDKSSQITPAPDPSEKPQYPEEVANWIEILKPINAGSFKVSSGKTYILVSAGQKNTGGYAVERTALKDSGDKVTITVKFKEPPRGAAVTQAISYPYLLETINHPVKEVDFVNADNNQYVPVIRGLTTAKPITNSSANIKIMEFTTKNGLTITGLARSFEAVVTYDILDAAQKPLKKANVTSAGGAPDWGYFRISEKSLPAGAKYVEVYNVSPKDGTPMDKITLTIK